MTEISFGKFHGLGNDFIVSFGADVGIVRRGANPSSTARLAKLARVICDRHTGVGADGFLVVLKPQNRENHARVRFFNADGSEAEMSGNGIRCAAAFFLERARQPLGFMPVESIIQHALELNTLQLETVSGLKPVRLVKAGRGSWMFRVGMGRPILEPAKIPFRATGCPTPVVGFPLATARGVLLVTVTSMGNPHCSTFVQDFDETDWRAIGSEVENSKWFPNRTNVEFIKVRSKGEIEVRFWERGVGATASSGTGSCGAVVACILNGLTDRGVRVRTLVGMLEVDWRSNGEVTLTGPVELIAHGIYFYSEQQGKAASHTIPQPYAGRRR